VSEPFQRKPDCRDTQRAGSRLADGGMFAAKLEAVAHTRTVFGLSERRACGIIGVSRRVNSYASQEPDDGALRVRLRDVASERRRFGYRRLGYLLAREGITPNHKKLLRIYREEGLKVRRRRGRTTALVARLCV
jgi:putative transposase